MDSALEYLWADYRKWLDRYVPVEKRRKLLYSIAALGIFLSGFLAWRDESLKARDANNRAAELKGKLSALEATREIPKRSVQMSGFLQIDQIVVPTISPPLLTLGKRSALNVLYKNRGTHPIVGAKHHSRLAIIGGGTGFFDSERDTRAFNEFKQWVDEQKQKDKAIGGTIGPNQGIWATLTVPEFNEELIDQVKHGRVVIYLIGNVYWDENPDGTYVCFKMQPPDNVPVKDIVWQLCEVQKTK